MTKRKMKYLVPSTLLTLIYIIFLACNANALSLTFDYAGTTWGTMEILQTDSNTFSVDYTAAASLPVSAQATGFGFGPSLGDFSISNPLDAFATWDENDLDWVKLDNTSAIPNPANSTLSKSLFTFGATEGDPNNINVPGIGAGERDIFYLDFASTVSLADLQYVGVRLQGWESDPNGGSLFLTGDTPPAPVPEPATMLLFGTGLAGIAGLRARRKKQ